MERLAEHVARAMGDVDFFVSESFGWRGGVVLVWSGMRGVITVAAAQSLPDDTPFRPEVVLIAFVVAGTTLLVQGLTLPRVIRALKIPGDDPAADRAACCGTRQARAPPSASASAAPSDRVLDQAAGQREPGDGRVAEQRSRVVKRAQRHVESGELVGRRRVGVHDRTQVRPGRHDLGVNRILDVPRLRAIKHRTVRADQSDPAGVDFLKPPPGGLHPGAPAVGIADARVPPDHVALPGRRQRAGGLHGQQDRAVGVRGLVAHWSLIPHRPDGLTLGSWEAEVDILVVGGGIGGLTAALALARDGHQVRVLEKAALRA